MPNVPPNKPNQNKPKWHERWRTAIRATETGVVIGLWVAGIGAIATPGISIVLLAAGMVVGTISIFAEPQRLGSTKILMASPFICFFVLSAGYVFVHQRNTAADTEGASLFQIEQSQGARIEFTDIEPFYPPNTTSSDPFLFKFTYKNNGSIAAESPNIYQVILKENASAAQVNGNEDAAMGMIIAQAAKNPFSDSGNQILPGDSAFFYMGPKLSKSDYAKARSGQYPIGFGFVFKYIDAAIPPGYAKYTYFCAYLINNGSGGWQYCHSYNKVFVAKN